MPVKLLVTRAAEAGEPNAYVFDQERISVGRGSDNDLTLPDEQRVVSKRHAEIRREAGACQLVDLGSKNFTYLNSARLTSGQPRALQEGDVFKIGAFEIEFLPVEAPEAAREGDAQEPDKTVFAADFSNPFDEPAAALVEALREIAAAYEREAPARRRDALQEALRHDLDGFDEAGAHEAAAAVFDLLGVDGAGPPERAASERAVPAPQEASALQEVPAAQEAPAVEEVPAPVSSRDLEDEPVAAAPLHGAPLHSAPLQGDGFREDQLLSVLLPAVARMARIPWRFRHEFIGQTIVQSSEAAPLYEGRAEALRAYLLDPSLPEEAVEERFAFLQEALDKLVLHQMALLDGYRASVQTGARRLLDTLDPATKEEALAEEKKLYALLPMLSGGVVVRQLKEAHGELQGEDWAVAERRVFRPAFIKAYLARMTSAPEPH